MKTKTKKDKKVEPAPPMLLDATMLIQTNTGGIKRNAQNVLKSPEIVFVDAPIIRDKFENVRNAVKMMDVDKCFHVSNIETGICINDFRTKIINIVSGHKRKYTEKEFRTTKIDNTTIQIHRIK